MTRGGSQRSWSRLSAAVLSATVPEPSTLVLFAVASAAVLVIPGPAVLFIVARTLEQDRRAGLVSVLGVHVGSLVHVLAAAVGLSALLASSATAFTVVKYLGAAYLVFLGVQKLRHAGTGGLAAPSALPRRRLFWQGVVVQVLNPKTAVFFLAFLPQFVEADRGALAPQIVFLGGCFVLLGLLSDSAYALAAGAVGHRVRRSPRARTRLDRISGGTYVALGAVAAVTGERVQTA
jgi:threonine/homoserine/homoserine lactone efflux protein